MATEADTRANYIDPKLNEAGWNELPARVQRELYFTDGRKQAGGQRGKRKFADYLLVFNNKKIGFVEAKREDKNVTEGLGQAMNYAEILNIKFVYSSNGKEIYEFNMSTGRGQIVAEFPAPKDLYDRVFGDQNNLRDRLLAVPFDRSAGYGPRYYQENAINAALEAIAKGKQRILLTLATGTGKTYIAFQTVWKLYNAKWNRHGDERRPRVLYLADRNILIGSQTQRDFNPLEQQCTRVDGAEIRKRGGVIPTNANVFFAIYQGIIGNTDKPYYMDYPKDFFDLVIIDECHRGSSKDESQWREVLNYFSNAVHLGLTATPKRKDNVDTYAYFGAPEYIYSLKEGINDGFLTPFKVKRISTTLDEYRYTQDDEVVAGEVAKEVYEKSDFNTNIHIRQREDYLVRILLDSINQKEKTIVFCANQNHALLIRDLINKHKDSNDPNYCVRVTAAEGEVGDQHLRNFQDNEKTIPTILTTSQKLSTGVDARNVRNIVLMRPVNTMIEFKQIIGRGTRVYDGKDFFTIVDFYDNVRHFSDPEWDGEPEADIQIKETEAAAGTADKQYPDAVEDSGPATPYVSDPALDEPKEKLTIRLSDGKERTIQHMVETLYFDEAGKPVTAQQFLEKLFGALPGFFKDEERLRILWSNPATRKRLLDELALRGFDSDKLKTMQQLIDAEDSDLYDVLRYVAFAKEALTREYRGEHVSRAFFGELTEDEEVFVKFVLDKYEQTGVEELAEQNLANLLQIKYGSSHDAVRQLGGVDTVRSRFLELQKELYAVEK
jgi:type I restriction enzyme R subunit